MQTLGWTKRQEEGRSDALGHAGDVLEEGGSQLPRAIVERGDEQRQQKVVGHLAAEELAQRAHVGQQRAPRRHRSIRLLDGREVLLHHLPHADAQRVQLVVVPDAGARAGRRLLQRRLGRRWRLFRRLRSRRLRSRLRWRGRTGGSERRWDGGSGHGLFRIPRGRIRLGLRRPPLLLLLLHLRTRRRIAPIRPCEQISVTAFSHSVRARLLTRTIPKGPMVWVSVDFVAGLEVRPAGFQSTP